MSTSGNFPLTFRLQVQGDAEVTSKFAKVGTAIKQISPAANQMQGSINQAGTSFRNLGTEAAGSSTKFQTFTGALSSLGTNIRTVDSGSAALVNTFRNTSAQVSDITTKSTGYTGALQNTGIQLTDNIAKNSQYSGALTSMTTQSRGAATATDDFTGALGSFSTENSRAKGGLDQTNTVARSSVSSFDKLGSSTDKTKSKMSGFAEVFRGNRGLIFSLSMVTSGAFEAQGMLSMLADSQQKHSEAQARVNELVAEGVTSGREYEQATKAVDDAQRGLSFATRNTMLSLTDLIPLSIMLASSLIDLGGKGKSISGVFTTMGSKVSGLGGALKSVPGHIAAISTAMGALTLRHPWILAIAAASAAIVTLATNAGGARDKVNEFSDSIAKNAGPLEGFIQHNQKGWNNILDLVKQGIDGLTGAGDKTVETAGVMGQSLDSIGIKTLDMSATMEESSLVVVGAQGSISDAAEKTKDITTFSIGEQIRYLQDLEKENQEVTVSALAALQKRESGETQFTQKYHQYALARRADDDAALEQLRLTAKEEEEFNKMFIEGNEQAAEANKKKNEEIIKAEAEAAQAEKNRMFAFTASAEEQLRYLELLRTNSQDKTVLLINLMKDEQTAEAEWNQKHQLFIKGYVQGDEQVRQSLGMTQSEFEQHKSAWESGLKEMGISSEDTQKQIIEDTKKRAKEFADEWKKGVDNVINSFETFRSKGTSTLSDVGQKLLDIAEQARKATDEYINGEGKRKERKEEYTKTMLDLYDQEEQAIGSLSVATAKAGVQWVQFEQASTTAMNNMTATALTGDFPGAIQFIDTALDATPEKWKGASGQLEQVLGNVALTAQDKAHLISANMQMLETAFTPVQVGAEFVGQAAAQAAAGLDELAAASLANVNPMTQMDTAWKTFVTSLTPAQQQLGLVQAVIKGVENNTMTAAQGFQTLEAAGVTASQALGETVTTSLANLEHQIINLGNGTQATVAKMDGQWISLGTSTATNLGPSGAQGQVQNLEGEMTNLGTTAQNELASNVPGAMSTTSSTANTEFNKVVDYANLIIEVFKAVSTYANDYLNTGVGRSVNAMTTAFSSASTKVTSFGNSAVSSLRSVAAQAGGAEQRVKALQKAIDALKSKTITITVNLEGAGAGHLQHGGSFLTHAQSGFSGIVNRPQKVGGVTMGESFKPELVTVMPLTRGTGNHTGPTMSSGVGGGSGGRPIEIHIHNEVGGREVNRFIKKIAL